MCEVYGITSDAYPGQIKIGYGIPEERIMEAQRWHPDSNLKILYRFEGNRTTESWLHILFSADRVRQDGEWFKISDRLIRTFELNVLEGKQKDDLPRFYRSEAEEKEVELAYVKLKNDEYTLKILKKKIERGKEELEIDKGDMKNLKYDIARSKRLFNRLKWFPDRVPQNSL